MIRKLGKTDVWRFLRLAINKSLGAGDENILGIFFFTVCVLKSAYAECISVNGLAFEKIDFNKYALKKTLIYYENSFAPDNQ